MTGLGSLSDTDSNDSDLISPEEIESINMTSLRYADPKKVIKRMKGIPFSCAPNCVCKGPREERRMRGPQASASCQTVLSPRFARTNVDCFEPARSHKGRKIRDTSQHVGNIHILTHRRSVASCDEAGTPAVKVNVNVLENKLN